MALAQAMSVPNMKAKKIRTTDVKYYYLAFYIEYISAILVFE